MSRLWEVVCVHKRGGVQRLLLQPVDPLPQAWLLRALPPRHLGSSFLAASVGPAARTPVLLGYAPQRLWLANQEKKGRGRGAWRMRTVRGERQALMVASSLAVSRSSCSWGLKTTELTTSWCRSLARQML